MSTDPDAKTPGFFPPTLWTMVIQGKEGDEAALNRLFERYRCPIILEIESRRRKGYADAEEVGHEFIAALLRRDFLRRVKREHGRFRALIKFCLKNFLVDLSRRAKDPVSEPAEPVGDDAKPLWEGLPDETDEDWPTLDRAWVLAVVAGAMERLAKECQEAGPGPAAYFESLKTRLTLDGQELDYAQIAEQLGGGVDAGAVRVAHHRLRKRLIEHMKDVVRETTGSAADFDREWETLRAYAVGR